MDYQRFYTEYSQLSQNWGGEKTLHFLHLSDQFSSLFPPELLLLLNVAVSCLAEDEVYCEISANSAVPLISALLNQPDTTAYIVQDSSDESLNFSEFLEQVSKFELPENVILLDQNFEEFFAELRQEFGSDLKIGLYFYANGIDYRSQLMGLLLAKSFFSEQTLIIIPVKNDDGIKQANLDFLASHPQCQLLFRLSNWHILLWDSQQYFPVNTEIQENRNSGFIQALVTFNQDWQRQKKQKFQELQEAGNHALNSSQFLEAIQVFSSALELDFQNGEVLQKLGFCYFQIGDSESCLNFYQKALAVLPNQANLSYEFAQILETLNLSQQAIFHYKEAIKADISNLIAWQRLVEILLKEGEYQEAETTAKQLINSHPQQALGYIILGNALIHQELYLEAISAYETALKYHPVNPSIFDKLAQCFQGIGDLIKANLCWGDSHYLQGRFQDAINYYQEFINLGGQNAAVYLSLGGCYELLEQYRQAVQVYQQGIQNFSNLVDLRISLILAYLECGENQLAIQVAEEVLQQFPESLELQLENQRILPILYEDLEEIEFYRHRFQQLWQEINLNLNLQDPEIQQILLKGINQKTNFYLQYQGKNDLELQQQFGDFLHHLMQVCYPQWCQILRFPRKKSSPKIRVGYISDYLRESTVGKLAQGWFLQQDRSKLEVYAYSINSLADQLTEAIKNNCDRFYHLPPSLAAVAQQILADELDILVYLDIGMHPLISQLASLRLAPIQCTSWLHPTTSGLPTIDYFLSSDLMEPGNAADHYSETLICLPNLGICYSKPEFPKLKKSRREFQLQDDAVIYLACQVLYKYLPQYDYIWAEIATQVPQAQFVFIARPNLEIAQKFQQRLHRTFAKYNLEAEKFCVMLPKLNSEDYWQLNQLSDVFLDSFDWSGGHTTLEAVACNLPIVTYPGELMRGRHSYAILKRLGIEETIAKSKADYIQIAVKLAQDPAWRNSIMQRIATHHSDLYDDTSCVRALENFYQQAIQQAKTPWV